MLVYTEEITPRLEYVFQLVIEDILGLDLKLTSDRDHFNNRNEPKINYSIHPLQDSFTVKPASLLFEKGLRDQNQYAPVWEDVKVLYLTDPDSDIPFDPFAASFYMVSRYEEYFDWDRDEHGRFDAFSSFAYKNDFQNIPVVDRWAMEMAKNLKAKFPGLRLKKRDFRYRSSIDVDEAFAFKHKGLGRTLGGLVAPSMNAGKGEYTDRLKVLFGRKLDPYQTFDLLEEWHSYYKIDPIFFFLVGKHGKYDKNSPVRKRAYKRLVRELAEKYDVGIHPSYRSNSEPEELEREIFALEKLTGKPVTRSRQHYLKLSLPGTYRKLISLGIKDDYTMGFAAETGFRAGTATPFYFYDLEKEEKTSLRIHPFQVMDGTLCEHLRLEPQEASDRIRELVNQVKAVNGTFISIWHNSSLSERNQWKDWRFVYEEMLKIGSGKEE